MGRLKVARVAHALGITEQAKQGKKRGISAILVTAAPLVSSSLQAESSSAPCGLQGPGGKSLCLLLCMKSALGLALEAGQVAHTSQRDMQPISNCLCWII